MGEVYKAKDTRLDRMVAVKVLPSHLSDSPELKARFEREAKAISQLSHPHICALYDVGSADGAEYLVMELLEGQSLADRLEKGPLPTAQVLKFGVEIADALDRAHRAGIIHRDLKPGNVMLTKSGVKLLDFGLAKFGGAAENAAVSALSSLPTELSPSQPLTERGTVMGTFQYMAPEQLEGKEADSRSDLFSFGCVLYEMATGKRAFTGKSRASMIAAILEHDPAPISSIAPMTPPALDRVVTSCLAKDPEDRWQSAHDVKSELAWIAEAGSQAGAPATVRTRQRRFLTMGWAVAAAVGVLAVILGMLLVRAEARASSQATRVIHARFLPPKGERLFLLTAIDQRAFAISPDGSRLVYAVEKGVTSELRLRSLDSGESTVIPGTEGAGNPFFSPDGKWIAFGAGAKLKKVAVAGGSPVTLCDAPVFRGAVWSEDGSIYFVPNVYVPISKISADGGPLTPVTRIRTKEGEQQHRWPEILPGGKVIVYSIGTGGDWDDATIVAERLDTGERKALVRGGTGPRYLPTGHLIYARAGALYAVALDARTLRVEGSPVEIVRNVRIDGSGLTHVDFSRNGTLISAPSDTAKGDMVISWIDRAGRGETLAVEHQSYGAITLSPDGRRVALNPGNSIAILDLVRLSTTKLSLAARAELPAWSRDGKRVYFGYEKEKFYQVYSKSADDSGAPQLTFPSLTEEDPFQVSRDGSRMLTLVNQPDGLTEIRVHALDQPGEPGRILVKSIFLANTSAVFSPDGRWIAYDSEESGRPEIYIRPSSGEDRKWQVSVGGGNSPSWSPHRSSSSRTMRSSPLTSPRTACDSSSSRTRTSAPRRPWTSWSTGFRKYAAR
jgi:serine/threonine-protein kinase